MSDPGEAILFVALVLIVIVLINVLVHAFRTGVCPVPWASAAKADRHKSQVLYWVCLLFHLTLAGGLVSLLIAKLILD